LAQQQAPASQHPLDADFAVFFVEAPPQQALESSQHFVPSWQQDWIALQQAWSLAQQFIAFVQHPSLTSAAQHASLFVQQALFLAQQSCATVLACGVSGLLESRPNTIANPERVLTNNMIELLCLEAESRNGTSPGMQWKVRGDLASLLSVIWDVGAH
jgi:hypothetical protein